MNPDSIACIDTPANRPTLLFLADLSAHSDVAEALQDAVRPLGDVQLHCPDRAAYRWVAVSTGGLIFAFAVGQQRIGIRLDERMKARALVSGAEPLPECGPEWVSLALFRDDWPHPDLRFWARKAYAAARNAVA